MPAALAGRMIMEFVPTQFVRMIGAGVVATGRNCCCTYLYREATGIDFRQFDGDLESARAAGAEAVQKADASPAAAGAIAGGRQSPQFAHRLLLTRS